MSPITIHHIKLPDGFADNILALPGNFDSVVKSNRGGWQSDLCDRRTFDWAADVYDQVIFAAGKMSGTYWFNINDREDYNQWHDHDRGTGGELCGCLYIRVPSSGGTFEYHVHPRSRKTNSIQPTPGMLILFPDTMSHCVTQHHTDEKRISMAFNFWRMLSKYK